MILNVNSAKIGKCIAEVNRIVFSGCLNVYYCVFGELSLRPGTSFVCELFDVVYSKKRASTFCNKFICCFSRCCRAIDRICLV